MCLVQMSFCQYWTKEHYIKETKTIRMVFTSLSMRTDWELGTINIFRFAEDDFLIETAQEPGALLELNYKMLKI